MKISRIVTPNIITANDVEDMVVESNIDENEVIIWDVIRSDDNEPEEIVLTTKYGLEVRAIYKQNVVSTLAAKFRERGVL